MEIPAWLYFWIWSMIGSISLFIGMQVLDQTDLSGSISPVAMSLFKHFLAISACHSYSYVLVFRQNLRISSEKYYIWASFAVSPLLFYRIVSVHQSFAWYFPIYSLLNLIGVFYYFLPKTRSFMIHDGDKFSVGIAFFPLVYYFGLFESFGWYITIYISNFLILSTANFGGFDFTRQTCLTVHFFVVSSIFFIGDKTSFFPILVLFMAFFVSLFWAASSGDERYKKWLPSSIQENRILLILRKRRKLITFAFGMLSTILFQYFFKLASFNHVVAFLFLSLAWLANLAMLLPTHDFGIFNFFLNNVIIGCTVNEFGLRGTTWLAYGVSVLLYSMRLKLLSLSLVINGEGEEIIVWQE